jgi:hypothetical protein
MRTFNFVESAFVLIAALGIVVFTGCGGSGVKTHPVAGKIEIPSGDIKPFTGHTVEVVLDSNPAVRAAGQIQEDGTFALETLQGGSVLKGAVEGTYKARIVLADDDISQRNLAAKAIPARYLQFEKSGLSLQVPTTENVSLKILRR